MDSENYKMFNCVSNGTNVHFVEDPLSLGCGKHFICKECSMEPNCQITCNICDDDKNNQNTSFFDLLINENLQTLFDTLKQRFVSTIETYKKEKFSINDRINSQIEYVKEEVEIKIESLKNELDNLNELINKELQDLKQYWHDVQEKNNYCSIMEIELTELVNCIENNKNLTKKNLYHYQNMIKCLQQQIDEYKVNAPRIKFDNSKLKLDVDLVGEISYNFGDRCLNIKELKNRILSDKNEIINIESKTVHDICSLPNDNLLITSFSPTYLILYDKNMSLVKKIRKINNQLIYPFGIDNDGIDSVYISDTKYNRIIKSNCDLTEFSVYPNNGSSVFSAPYGICYSNGHLYVCDCGNGRIHKLDSNLQNVDTYQLQCYPYYIKILNNLCCIRCTYFNSIYFYDIETFTLKSTYANHSGIIGIINKYICEYYAPENTIFFYDDQGKLLEQIKTNIFVDTQVSSSYLAGSIVFHKHKFLIAKYGYNKLIKF